MKSVMMTAVLLGGVVGLAAPKGYVPGDDEFRAMVAGADCEHGKADNTLVYHCNECNESENWECDSTGLNSKCVDYTNPYGCVACTTANIECGGNWLEYPVTPCSGNSSIVMGCYRNYDKANIASCVGQQTCPAP